MFGKIVSGVLSLAFFVVPCVCEAQIHERGMMRNRANVEIESSSYTIGIIKDTTKFKNSFIQFVNSTVEDDVAAESEDDIIYASFDNNSIHYYQQKFDYTKITEPIEIKLVNEEAKQYYACPFEGKVTSHFGPRRRRWHYGVDLGLRTGQPIKAMFDGKVRIAKRAGAYGNLVKDLLGRSRWVDSTDNWFYIPDFKPFSEDGYYMGLSIWFNIDSMQVG